MVNHLHQIVKLVLALKFFLAGPHLYHVFIVVDISLGAERFLKLVDFQC